MNHFKRFNKTFMSIVFLSLILPGALAGATYFALQELTEFGAILRIGAAAIIYIAGVLISLKIIMATGSKPLEMLWQAIWHVSPEHSSTPAPDPNKLTAGRELVSSLIMQIYDRASSLPGFAPQVATPTQPAQATVAQTVDTSITGTQLIESLPLPVFVLDKNWNIKASNNSAAQYLGKEPGNINSKSVHDVLRLSFSSEDTLSNWLDISSKNSATASKTWEQVKLAMDDSTSRKLDLAASYSKDNSLGNEAVLILFDKSGAYSAQDQATTFIAMAVHELRTPLTMLRGYIELFEDELGDNLSEEHREFMHKMTAASQHLSAFVSNILNVARIEENQLTLNLVEANWPELLQQIVSDMQNRAQVRGKKITLQIAPDLPTVGVDKISASEILINLLDNAIKYSNRDSEILVEAKIGKDNLVETTVTDKGIGIPENVLKGLFTKFYRSHRSKNAVGGSGLGLYLVKSMVNAHGGQVWATSKEGEGSTFGFSLRPFSDIAAEKKSDGSDGIQRQANGWIKNHTLYRR